MAQEPYSRFFRPPTDQRIGEFKLSDEGRPFRADMCYQANTGGYLFIEHDNAQTGLNNLAKYWLLVDQKRLCSQLFLIHIIDNKRPAATRLCKFIGQRFKDATNAKYFLLEVSDWHNSEWRDRLVEVLNEIIKELADQGVERAGDPPGRLPSLIPDVRLRKEELEERMSGQITEIAPPHPSPLPPGARERR